MSNRYKSLEKANLATQYSRLSLLLISCVFTTNGFAFSETALSCYQAMAGNDKDLAHETCYEAAKSGDAESQFKLAALLANMSGSDRQLLKESSRWLQKAAELGHIEAQYNLAYAFQYGKGVDVDPRQSLEWYETAAINGSAKAQRNLAAMYEQGQGGEQDEKLAFRWYRESAESGMVSSQTRVGIMLLEGRGVAADWDQAISWLSRAAEAGDPEAQFALGALLFEKDRPQAERWFNAAMEQGHLRAIHAFAQLLINSSNGDDKDQAKQVLRSAVIAGHPPSIELYKSLTNNANEPTNAANSHSEHSEQPWFFALPPDHYTLQLVVSSSIDRVASFILEHDLTDRARFHGTISSGNLIYVVTLGEFSKRDDAVTALNELPLKLQTINPFIRQISALQTNYKPADQVAVSN